jgi:hypothetical protein
VKVRIDPRGFGTIDGLIESPPAGPWDGINDGLHGGLGAFGVHVRLPNGETRHLDTVHWATDPGRDGWGVTSVGASSGNIRISYLGRNEPGRTRMFEVVTEWSERVAAAKVLITPLPNAKGCWFKEPKVSINGLTFAPGLIREIGYNNKLLKRHIVAGMSNPRKRTRQLVIPTHQAVSLGVRGRIVAEARDYGLLQWRRDVKDKAHPKGLPCPSYCHPELRPTWEFVRWPKRSGLLIHGWTGGAGQHECWCAGRPAPIGQTYEVRVGIERR